MRYATHATIALIATLSSHAKAEDEKAILPAADFTARQITSALFKAKAGERLDYSNHNLAYLDLAGLDFKGAKLARSDLYGTDFTGADLKGADLSYTRLNRSVLVRADLSGANLTGATIFRPNIYSDLASNLNDAPRFAGANLTDARVASRSACPIDDAEKRSTIVRFLRRNDEGRKLERSNFDFFALYRRGFNGC
jgi:uncharacterized protein YjbI with pentapeptide repeats